MVGYPQDVEDVWTRDDGIFAGAKPGTILVDMTTSTPHLAEQLAQTGADLG
ncbi:3-hydroxyisobutyrate dehydrogenase, partial [Leuconostoc pseudomesenteroides]